MLARVSNVEAFRRWRLDDEASVDDLVARITGAVDPSPAMLAGTAFHQALETAEPGDYATLTALGHTFHLADAEVALPGIREVRTCRDYGGITITGQADLVHGRTVTDHKTTARFNPEGYIEGFQWRAYLDIFEADVFRWNVFVIKEVGPLTYEVEAPHVLTCFRYPALHEDCSRLAAEYRDFALAHLPEAA